MIFCAIAPFVALCLGTLLLFWCVREFYTAGAWYVDAMGCHLHRAFRDRVSPSGSLVRRTMGGPPIRSAVARVPRPSIAVADLMERLAQAFANAKCRRSFR